MTMSGVEDGYYEIESIAVCYLEEESLAAYLSTCSDLVSFYRVENPCCDANNDGSLMRVTPPGTLAATGVPELPDCSSVWSLYVAWNCGADILLSPTGSSAGSSTVNYLLPTQVFTHYIHYSLLTPPHLNPNPNPTHFHPIPSHPTHPIPASHPTLSHPTPYHAIAPPPLSPQVSVGINVPAGEPHPTTLVPICSE